MCGAASEQLAGEGGGALDEVATFDETIDQPDAQCIGRGDRSARESHVERLLHADEAGETLRPFGARDDAERHLGESEARALRGDAIVAGHRQLQPATKCRPMNRGDDRLREVLDLGEQRMQVGADAVAPRRLLQFTDVGAGDEGASRAGDDDGACVDAPQCLGERLAHGGVERVHRRVVDRDDGDVAISDHGNETAHGCAL